MKRPKPELKVGDYVRCKFGCKGRRIKKVHWDKEVQVYFYGIGRENPAKGSSGHLFEDFVVLKNVYSPKVKATLKRLFPPRKK